MLDSWGSYQMRISSILLLLVLLGLTAPVPGQNLPHTPELLGLYPGMPSLAARAQLQKHSSDVYVQDISGTAFGMTIPNPKNRDQISVFLTLPPSEPTVWMIQRAQTFDPGVSMSKENLLAALRKNMARRICWRTTGRRPVLLLDLRSQRQVASYRRPAFHGLQRQ